ncbi:hypothetical protein A2U01_0112536, partial [Trifolium medium]|nr:hypothetical protein [Trifolium medium]
SGTRRRQSTLALGYLKGDREDSGMAMEPLCYVSIVAEEVQNSEDLQGGN